jgi:hypothetical protein
MSILGQLNAAQLRILLALGACFLFVANTTGGTLFLFSTSIRCW